MKLNKFFSLFDKKRFKLVFKLSISIIVLVIVVNLLEITYSKYESTASIYNEAKTAYFVVNQGTVSGSIALTDLIPSNEPFIYPINVYNYDQNKRTDINLKYTIAFETTTNLPIQFDVIANETYSEDAQSVISSTEIIQDGDMYYKRYVNDTEYNFGFLENQMNQYTLVIRFPYEYKDYPDLYQGNIELIKVIITAEQLV